MFGLMDKYVMVNKKGVESLHTPLRFTTNPNIIWKPTPIAG